MLIQKGNRIDATISVDQTNDKGQITMGANYYPYGYPNYAPLVLG